MSGKAPRDPGDQTSAKGSVEYDIITGKMRGSGSAENVDSLGNTMLGNEVKERFSSMRAAFLKMDCNRDGSITVQEIRNLCRQWNIPQSEADRVLDAADMDANGTMDFNEFAKRFDPDYDRPIDGDPLPMASSTAYGAVYDNRPIASKGWAFDEQEYNEQQAAAATKIQAAAKGRQARASVSAKRTARGGGGARGGGRAGPGPLDGDAGGPCSSPKGACETPAGSGSRAARTLKTEQLEAENAELKARVEELEEENAMLKKALAASQAREAGGGGATMEKTRSPAEASGRGGGGGGGRGGAARGATADLQEDPGGDEEPLQDVVLYGRQDDKKTQAVMSELKKNGVSFDALDFDSTKEYMSALKASGFPSNAKVVPPVVVVRGKHAFWDEPDAAIAVHFPSMLVNELRKLGLVGGGLDETGPMVPRNVSMDVEIAERFHNMQQAFLKCDDNKDGRVSKDELRKLCKNWNIPQSEAERVVREADFDSNGTLDFREFARRFGR